MYSQCQSFVDDGKTGYQDGCWWERLDKKHERPGEQHWPIGNHPRENVSWYDAIAFCRWLNEQRLGKTAIPHDAPPNYVIRLPMGAGADRCDTPLR
jgi:formylglycine-generating enzyme required for sulfatase activity